MGFEVVLLCALFCMLQFHIGDVESTKLQIRIPDDSIDGYPKNPQFNTGVPYPLYRRGNFCSRCNSNCGSNSPVRLKCPTNPYVISVPSDKSKSGRLTITIDARKSCKSAKPADNGEISKQTVDVLVKLVPKNQTRDNSSTSTSGKSSATSNKDGDVLTANMDGTIDFAGSGQVLDVVVLVNSDDSGKGPGDKSLDTKIVMDNGKGKVSETDSQADIKKTPEKKTEETNPSANNKPVDKPSDTPSPDPTPVDSPAPSDDSDSTVTGATSDPVKPDDTGSAPADTSTPGDSKTPEPIKADPEEPSSTDNGKPSTSSSAAPTPIADDKTAPTGSTSSASADSG